MYRRISYCALLGMEGREERKEQAAKRWRDGKVRREREEEEGKRETENMSADTAVSLFQSSLRSSEVLLICLDCKTCLQLQNTIVAEGNVRETVCFPDGEKNLLYYSEQKQV